MYVPEKPGERVETPAGVGTWTGDTDGSGEHFGITIDGETERYHKEDLADPDAGPTYEYDRRFSYQCPRDSSHMAVIGNDEEPDEVTCGTCAADPSIYETVHMELVHTKEV